MLLQEASTLDLDIYFLDKAKDYPALQLTEKYTLGDFNDYHDVLAFAKSMDIITIEIENVNVAALKEIEKSGVKVIPSSKCIETIKDKGLQKSFYLNHNIPSSKFDLYQNKQEIITAFENNKISLPFVQKSRTEGYDGKGVQIIKRKEDLEGLLDTASVIEELVDIKKETALIAAKNASGEIQFFNPVEMVFEGEANLLDYLLCPAEIDASQIDEMKEIARELLHHLDFIGLLAIEFFIDQNDNIYINEIAPRTHNSGHHTIDACINSQFNIQLRCLLNLSLGNSSLKFNYAGIVNLLGDAQCNEGPVKYYGLDEIMSINGVYPHIYGKKTVKPYRKMGHVNICADTKEQLLENIRFIKNNIKVTS